MKTGVIRNGGRLDAFFSGVVLLVCGVLYLGFGVDRTFFWSLFPAILLAFGGYGLLVGQMNEDRFLRPLLMVGVMLRVALVFAFPLLSDDLYRFLWDGYLINAGYNPFVELPAYYLEPGHTVPGLTPELFARLNSPDYYTIYPPIAQGVFAAATWLAPTNWYGAAVVMKLFLFGAELGTLWLLWQLLRAQGPPVNREEQVAGGSYLPERRNILLYWLNPLVIVELTGNLHFEGVMIFFLLLAWYLLQRQRRGSAAIAFAAAVASKLLPLLLLPFLIRRLWQPVPGGGGGERRVRRWWIAGQPFVRFSIVFGASCGLFFAPLLLSPGFIAGFRSSLALYQQKFEFNASIYYLARAWGYYQVGWNQIALFGPWLARLAAVGILFLAWVDKRRDWASLANVWLWAFVLYLLLATTVHPWYLGIPIVLCVFTRWRFPLWWSFLIMLTYTSYLTVPYRELLWLVALEYGLVVAYAIREWWKCRQQNLTEADY